MHSGEVRYLNLLSSDGRGVRRRLGFVAPPSVAPPSVEPPSFEPRWKLPRRLAIVSSRDARCCGGGSAVGGAGSAVGVLGAGSADGGLGMPALARKAPCTASLSIRATVHLYTQRHKAPKLKNSLRGNRPTESGPKPPPGAVASITAATTLCRDRPLVLTHRLKMTGGESAVIFTPGEHREDSGNIRKSWNLWAHAARHLCVRLRPDTLIMD